MAGILSHKVRFKKVSIKALIQRLEGPEPSYPVYYMGKTIKFERPEVPGKEYRWLSS